MAKVGRDPQGLIVHHVQDAVYTSYRWLSQLLIADGVVSCCEQGAKDNPKNPSRDGDWEELEWAVERRMNYAGCERRHSSLDYRSSIKVRG